ncbi:PIH1 domain-containing protein 1-like [Phyllobates terribilis]|uniref:PIH1 domain-containing protein 1-like n=1 Tax=Phyllobates terribilis TaxID=111132 RepID=UPI003CCA83AF
MASDKSLLSAEMNTNMEEALYEQMLMKAKQEIQSRIPNLPESRLIRPQLGFCIKTRTSKNTKIFINICKSNQISAPPDLTEHRELPASQDTSDKDTGGHQKVSIIFIFYFILFLQVLWYPGPEESLLFSKPGYHPHIETHGICMYRSSDADSMCSNASQWWRKRRASAK